MEAMLEALRREVELSVTMLGAILLAAEMGEPMTLSDAIAMLRRNARETDGATSVAMWAMAEHFEMLHTSFGLTRCSSKEH